MQYQGAVSSGTSFQKSSRCHGPLHDILSTGRHKAHGQHEMHTLWPDAINEVFYKGFCSSSSDSQITKNQGHADKYSR